MSDETKKKRWVVRARRKEPVTSEDRPLPEFPVVEWDLHALKAHPKQALHFSPPSYEEGKELARDIEANGLREPLPMLPARPVCCPAAPRSRCCA